MTEPYRPEPPQGNPAIIPEYPGHAPQQSDPHSQPYGYGDPAQHGYQPYQNLQPHPSYGQQFVNSRTAQAESDKKVAMIMAILSFFVAPIPCGPLAWWFANKSIANGGDAHAWKIIGIIETFLPIVFIAGLFAFATWATSVGLT